MSNLRKAQAAYDAMTPDDPLEYRDSDHYLNWIEVVTKQIVSGDSSYGLNVDLVKNHADPASYVYSFIDDDLYFKFCESQRDYD